MLFILSILQVKNEKSQHACYNRKKLIFQAQQYIHLSCQTSISYSKANTNLLYSYLLCSVNLRTMCNKSLSCKEESHMTFYIQGDLEILITRESKITIKLSNRDLIKIRFLH
jgi:hypothetical protein